MRINDTQRRQANARVTRVLGPTYFNSLPIVELQAALAESGMRFAESFILTGREGRALLDLTIGDNQPIENSVLVLTWYKMESGRYEVGGYVS